MFIVFQTQLVRVLSVVSHPFEKPTVRPSRSWPCQPGRTSETGYVTGRTSETGYVNGTTAWSFFHTATTSDRLPTTPRAFICGKARRRRVRAQMRCAYTLLRFETPVRSCESFGREAVGLRALTDECSVVPQANGVSPQL